MIDKIKARQDLPAILDAHRQRGLRIVLTNGCFDLLHIGHIRYLQSARALGDLLIVAVNSDSSVRLLGKGPGRPIVPEAHRAEVLAALSCVDYVVLFDEPSPLEIITFIQPDILAKGGDWTLDQIVGRDPVESRKGTVHILPLVPDTSTTFLIEKKFRPCRLKSVPRGVNLQLEKLPKKVMAPLTRQTLHPQTYSANATPSLPLQ